LYHFEAVLDLAINGGTSRTTSILFAGSATISSILWTGSGLGSNGASIQFINVVGRSTAAVQISAATSSNPQNMTWTFKGQFRTGASGGTFKPQFKFSAAPGAAPTVRDNTFFNIYELGADTATEIGTWA
jgi:hypothetical protein